MTKNHIDAPGFAAILVLTVLWGFNYTAIKYSNSGLSPVFTTAIRSVIASALGIVYCLVVRQPVFHKGILLFHGAMVGILFGLEFVCLYLGMLYTDAARASIFVYLSPFIVAAGAHFFLGERMDALKIIGLVLAFTGVYLVFMGRPVSYNRLMLAGDILEIAAAVLWAATTLYIKKYLAQRVHPINTFLYQLVFSIPIMFVCAYALEAQWVKGINGVVVASLVYQSVIIAFASYFVWFKLIHIYPVARLSAFTFLTPVFGVLFGRFILREELTASLVAGLLLVCSGIFCTNYRKT